MRRYVIGPPAVVLSAVSALFILVASAVAQTTQRLEYHCGDSNWALLFRIFESEIPVEINSPPGPRSASENTVRKGYFEVAIVSNGLKVLRAISGELPRGGVLPFSHMNAIWMNTSAQTESLIDLLSAPVHQAPIRWEGSREGRWTASYNAAPPDERAALDNLDSRRFFVVVYMNKDGRWGFPLQTLCDLALLRSGNVYVPTYPPDRKGKPLWVSHPRATGAAEFEKLILEEIKAKRSN